MQKYNIPFKIINTKLKTDNEILFYLKITKYIYLFSWLYENNFKKIINKYKKNYKYSPFFIT